VLPSQVAVIPQDSVSRLVDSLRTFASTANDKASTLAWGALAVAFLALFVGPLIQLRIAKAQIRATVLSANRQKWIDALRAQVAAFMALTVETNLKATAERGKPTYYDALKPDLAKLRAIEFNIVLALNPTEADHQQLADSLNEVVKWFIGGVSQERKLKDFIDTIRDLSRTIFKREWERVKTLS
jgi:hypothetical protein